MNVRQALSERWLWIAPGVFLWAVCFSRTTALRNVALLATLLLVVGCRSWAWWRGFPAWPALLAWAAVAIGTLPWARDLEYSAGAIKSEIGHAFVTVWVFYVLGRDERALAKLRVPLLAGVLTASAVAIGWYALSPATYHSAPHGGQGVFSTLLVTVYPLLLAWALERGPAHRPVVIAAIATILVAAGYTTLNRALWFAVVLETLLLTALWPGQHQRIDGNRLLKPLAALALVAALMAATVLVQRAAIDSGPGTTVAAAIREDPRWAIWHFSVQEIGRRPWTGAGFGRAVLAERMREQIGPPDAWHAHNWFLGYGIQTGLPGIATLLFVLGTLAWRFGQARAGHDPPRQSLSAVGFALLAGMIAKNTTDDFFVDQTALVFWALTGLLLGTLTGPPGARCDRFPAEVTATQGGRTRKTRQSPMR